ncbi:uncharacterized protein K452DRAFT_360852 [Aplosporella prunicola CBS 121167]|uniref:Pentatricopeptide repeat domain-containing protein n=1 Tax=Aplosporella prunicola CBS 121167 TaxID=1176127 RepID=A0A6A6B7C9_9PEZI|nr:uncharacterized protein K452DRAFT_360852 [Aplosporella prunicola CBS 121167]KAF2139145.1 hypothetical protein K452DRAFT_360852 [Aplosporella prunicola CBS 121167]
MPDCSVVANEGVRRVFRDSWTTNLLPLAKTIVLLVEALPVGDPVLAENPAVRGVSELCSIRTSSALVRAGTTAAGRRGHGHRERADTTHPAILIVFTEWRCVAVMQLGVSLIGRLNDQNPNGLALIRRRPSSTFFPHVLPASIDNVSRGGLRAVQCHVGGKRLEAQFPWVMRTALDRLLARPSALRVLRSLITDEQYPFVGLARSPCQWSQREWRRTNFTGAKWRHEEAEIQERATEESQPSEALPRYVHNEGGPNQAREMRASPQSEPELDNMATWVSRLQFRERVYGSEGVKDTWKEMKGKGVDLPTAGIHAEALWKMFLAENDIVKEVVSYAESVVNRTGQAYPALYETVISQCFVNRKHAQIYRWHDRLLSVFPPLPGAFRRIAPRSTNSKSSLDAFEWIYVRGGQRDIYDALITSLCEKGLYKAALRWHSFLVKLGDFPSSAAHSKPMRTHFEKYGNALSLLELSKTDHVRGAQKSSPAEPQDANGNPFSRETMYRIMGKSHAIQPKQMDDHFCARIFATKAFSIDVIISGLSMFGIDTIGPLALREMASRTEDCHGLLDSINRLKQSGISISTSVFARAIQRFAETNRMDLLQGLLASDQHPDTFEDLKLQKELLTSFVTHGDWPAAHRTLAFLTIFHSNPDSEQWNILLRTTALIGDISRLNKVLEDMRSHHIPLSEASQSALQKYWLRTRRKGKAPTTHHRWMDMQHDDTTLVANVYLATMESGGHIDPQRWTEVFRRYGMVGRFNDVVKLALWLAMWYSPKDKTPHARISSLIGNPRSMMLEPKGPSNNSPPVWVPTGAIPPTHPAHPLRRIFSPIQLAAFIAWGFRYGLYHPAKRNPKMPIGHTWARGLRLVKQLRDRGVYVSAPTVRKELKTRFMILFSNNRRSKILSNRRARLNNPHSLSAMVQRVNELWDRPLLKEDDNKMPNGVPGVKWKRFKLESHLGGHSESRSP